MKPSLLDALWRAAVLASLVWIGISLHQIHADMQPAADDSQSSAADPEDPPDGSDDVEQQLAQLNQKLDAIMIAMAQLRR